MSSSTDPVAEECQYAAPYAIWEGCLVLGLVFYEHHYLLKGICVSAQKHNIILVQDFEGLMLMKKFNKCSVVFPNQHYCVTVEQLAGQVEGLG